MHPFPIHALKEGDLDSVIEEAGGDRAHPDADKRELTGADYVLGRTVIELKMLDDEGFDKPERQAKLAALFGAIEPDRPVVVLDPAQLPPDAQRKYRGIIEGPVKKAAAKARQQLGQTRSERPDTTGSVLWIFNNGYTALDHDTLEEVVANRVRQDSSSIDGIIVSGCYYHSDGFDSVFLWPCTYIPIRLDHGFPEFEALQQAFQGFANSFMTEVMQREAPQGRKLAVRDIVFDMDGVRYVRPAPVMGSPSDFFIRGRPRGNSSGIEQCPPVALIIPRLDRASFDAVVGAVVGRSGPLEDHAAWQAHARRAAEAATPTKPLVAMPVVAADWLAWCSDNGHDPTLRSLNGYAHTLFDARIRHLIDTARERTPNGLVLSTFILAVTEEIGQDRANDVSHVAAVREPIEGDPIVRPLVENIRIFHEHAVALAAAYAIAQEVDAVLWTRSRRHGWF